MSTTTKEPKQETTADTPVKAGETPAANGQAPGAEPADTATKLTEEGQEFVMTAGRNGLFEIEAGQVAQQRVGLGPAHPDRPRPAGHLQQHGRLAVCRQIGAAPDVGPVRTAVRSVLHGAGLLHVAAPDEFIGRHSDERAPAPRRL